MPAQYARLAALGVALGSLGHGIWLEPTSAAWFACPAVLFVTVLKRSWFLFAVALGFSAAFLRFDYDLTLVRSFDPSLTGWRKLSGVVVEINSASSGGKLLLKSAAVQEGSGNRLILGTTIVATESPIEVRTGDRIQTTCRLREAKPPLVAMDTKIRKLVSGYCAGAEAITVNGRDPPLAAFAALRSFLNRAMSRALSSPESELGAGLLIGSATTPLPQDTAETFRRTGLSHIVAASGYNVAVVAAWCTAILFTIGLGRRQTLVASIACIAGYVALAGVAAAVVRAGVMASAATVAALLGRDSRAGHALTMAAAAMLVLQPELLLFDVGFELSVAATFGLTILGPRIAASLPEAISHKLLGRLFSETTAATIATLPIILWRFGNLSLIAVVANLTVVPAVPLGMLAALLAVIAGLVPVPFLGALAALPLDYILNATGLFAALPFASVALGPFPWWAMLPPYLLLAAWLYFPRPEPTRVVLDRFEGWQVDAT